ncbi:MAG: hypothetical protein SFX72_08540 [Isosphaeraceae bacterium]|jgi:lysyl-tRNA synthetase class I|nr:hypothetical protein [Isosphaeraceae bacterium]
MSQPRDAAKVLDRDFLELRARILELAAAFDRIERATAGAAADRRREQLKQAVELLLSDRPGRAEAVQLHFSYEYDPQWREKFGLAARSR